MSSNHDAILEAEAWKQTAAKWRKRALQQAGNWRRRCKKLAEELDDVNERGAELSEELSNLRAELGRMLAPEAADELRRQNAKMKAERDEALNKALVPRLLEERVARAERDAAAAYARVGKIGKDADESIHRAIAEKDAAVAALRVAAERLAVNWKGAKDVHALASLVDAAILKLQDGPFSKG